MTTQHTAPPPTSMDRKGLFSPEGALRRMIRDVTVVRPYALSDFATRYHEEFKRDLANANSDLDRRAREIFTSPHAVTEFLAIGLPDHHFWYAQYKQYLRFEQNQGAVRRVFEVKDGCLRLINGHDSKEHAAVLELAGAPMKLESDPSTGGLKFKVNDQLTPELKELIGKLKQENPSLSDEEMHILLDLYGVKYPMQVDWQIQRHATEGYEERSFMSTVEESRGFRKSGCTESPKERYERYITMTRQDVIGKNDSVLCYFTDPALKQIITVREKVHAAHTRELGLARTILRDQSGLAGGLCGLRDEVDPREALLLFACRELFSAIPGHRPRGW